MKGVFLSFIVFFVNNVYAYPLTDEFYILNQSKNIYEIKYSVCTTKSANGAGGTTCIKDNILTLNPHQSSTFFINSNDNYHSDKNNYHYRYIFIYEIISPISSGFYLSDSVERDIFKKDYAKISTKPTIAACVASSGHNVILDDFGTDRIYCR